MKIKILFLLLIIVALACQSNKKGTQEKTGQEEFPSEMVSFQAFENNPIFSGTNQNTWDALIRERGYILAEDGIYKMWYSGYGEGETDIKHLGYATSTDGINWERYPDNPIFDEKWTEDMFVIKNEGIYYMYAEGDHDIAHLLTSTDGISWEAKGDLVIRQTNGDTIPAPYGTPTVWIEDGKWYLFYERNDLGIWLATSDDHLTWTNIQDEPVLNKGPETYDKGAVALNQVIEFKGKYYMFYHGSDDAEWATPGATSLWTSNVAVSDDLLHWVKYPGNPVVEGDHSSPVMVYDGKGYRLYTMHNEVCLYLPK